MRGRARPPTAAEEPPAELLSAISRASWILPGGFTIGPAEPEPGRPPTLEIQRILSDLEVADLQGWLGPSASFRRIRESVIRIRETLETGDRDGATRRASATLRKFVSGEFRGVLPEGRALLRAHLERVLENVRKR